MQEQVNEAIRKHRARTGQPFPYGSCYQPYCPHRTVAEVMGLPWPVQPKETYKGRHRDEDRTPDTAHAS